MIDVRSADDFEDCHVSGAINFPYRQINAETVERLPRDKVLIVYCWGPGCNASTKAALRFSQLGFRVKEMIGGIEYWRRENGAVEGRLAQE